MKTTGAGRESANIAIVIPCLNEEAVIGAHIGDIVAVLATMSDIARKAEVIVVDNGSTDRTVARAAEAGARVVAEPRRGYGRACLSGAEAASGSDILVYMDGDRSDDPADIPIVLAPLLDDSADLVVGSRLSGSYEPGSLTAPQRVGNWVGCQGLARWYGIELTDFGPFRALPRELLLGLGMQEMTYGWPLEMLARAGKAGFRVSNVPVTWRKRAGGTSKVSGDLKASFDTGRRYLHTLYRCR